MVLPNKAKKQASKEETSFQVIYLHPRTQLKNIYKNTKMISTHQDKIHISHPTKTTRHAKK
jgi:hypothetical protein